MSEFWVGFMFGAAAVLALLGIVVVYVNNNAGPFL